MSITSEFIAKNKVKVVYVRDIFGYKKGVVVKIGKGKGAKYGWSLVASADYANPVQKEFRQLPVAQVDSKIKYDKIEVLTALSRNNWVSIPYFNVEIGRTLALNKALKNDIVIKKEGTIDSPTLPYDKDLIKVLSDLILDDKRFQEVKK